MWFSSVNGADGGEAVCVMEVGAENFEGLKAPIDGWEAGVFDADEVGVVEGKNDVEFVGCSVAGAESCEGLGENCAGDVPETCDAANPNGFLSPGSELV